MSDWRDPDFGDPRFTAERVHGIPRCDCGDHADWEVEFTERRGSWTYEYKHFYCAEHLPSQAEAIRHDPAICVASAGFGEWVADEARKVKPPVWVQSDGCNWLPTSGNP